MALEWLCTLTGVFALKFSVYLVLNCTSILGPVHSKLLGLLRHRISPAKRVSSVFEACKGFRGGRTEFLNELCFILGLAGIVGGTSVKRWTSVYNHGVSLLTITTCSP